MLLVVCFVLVGLVALMAIPSDVWALIAENCSGHRGQVRLRYVWRESKAVGNFYAGLLFGTLIPATLLLGAMVFFDSHVMPLSWAAEGVSEADFNPDTWKQRLTAGHDNLGRRYDSWYRETGATKQESDSAKHVLWNAVPIALVVGFACIVLVARFTSFGYSMAMDELVTGVSRRNRRRITKQYLRTSAQYDQRWTGDDEDPSNR